jgi:hypothetical protein
MTTPRQEDRPDPAEAETLWRDLEPYVRGGLGGPPIPPEIAERAERFARSARVDPDTVMPIHGHRNPVTGQLAMSASWPCPQCIALGRTEPLQYGEDVPDEGSTARTEIPPDRLEAYLASFPAPEPPLPAGDHRARRKARRAAERKSRRKNR